MKPKRFFRSFPSLFDLPVRYGVPVFAVLISGLSAEAGDILRGGRPATASPSGTNATGGTPTPAASDAARANARDTLARTTRTLDAMRAMQTAARQSAVSNPNPLAVRLPSVPNGLLTGGLKPATPTAANPTPWTGADSPNQTVSDGKTTVTIRQTTQQAVLHWETLNVGKSTTLKFDQSAGGENSAQWIAFNKVSDPASNPTQILGSIKADGQVYLINQNGIIFGGSSQVNARGLTASSLPINTNLIASGILNNPDAQFLFSGLDLPKGNNGTPAFIPEKPTAADGKYGDVVVEAGAVLTSPTNSASVGGRITLVGPNVTNLGTIETPDGQTILAAGLQVGFDAHAGSDASLRGLDTYIGKVNDPTVGLYAGTVSQQGLIEAPRGSIMIAGREIDQLGILNSTTSVALNGRIDLVAHYNAINNPNYNATNSSSGGAFLYQNSGSITLGNSSVMRIMPESASSETTIGTELALRSRINLAGQVAHLGVDSIMLAPNALVNISTGEWLSSGGANPISRFIQSTGQVYLDEGALIDVAGSLDVAVPVSQNIISVDLRGAELADSPLQRLGILRNATVQVDLRDAGIYQGEAWLGTPLADLAGFANLIQRKADQLTVAGGSVTISAGSAVVMQPGSLIDISGGSTRFEAGTVKTSRLITGGNLIDISTARPDVIYDGIYDGTFTETNAKFGSTSIYNSPLAPDGGRQESGYIEGAAGGQLTITAPAMALDGSLLGQTFPGSQQRQTPPVSSSLTLSFHATDKSYPSLPIYSPTPPKIAFGANPGQALASPFALDAAGNPLPLAAARTAAVYLPAGLFGDDGFGSLTVNNNDGDISVPAGVRLTAAPGSALALTASNLFIDGNISVPAGKLTFSAYNIPLSTLNLLNNTTGPQLPVALADRGQFVLGANASLNTAGLLVDDRASAADPGLQPLALNGGSISVKAYSAVLASGALVDVSGGAWVNSRSALTYGDAGSLVLAAGQDLSLSAVQGGRLVMDATLAGFSGAKAGSISISAPAIQVGGSSTNAAVNLLAPEWFNQNGFGTFSLTGTGLASGTPGEFVTGLQIAANAVIRPIVSTWVAELADNSLQLRQNTREEGNRPAATLSFNAVGALDAFAGTILGRGDVVLAASAVVQTDAKGAITFNGETVTLLGTATAPGGSITVTGAARFPSNDPNLLLPTVLLGESAHLSTAGKVILTENPFGLRQGSVLAGGSITLSGNLVADRGAVLDVSGTSGVLDLPPSFQSLDSAVLNSLSGKQYVPVELHSNGGRITLSGSRMLYSDATLIGRAGGASATGGSLTVSSGRFVALGAPSTTAETNLVVTQSGDLLPSGFVARGLQAVPTDSAGAPLPGIGHFTVSTMAAGGFDSLALNGNVNFDGNVAITLPGSLRVASGGVVSATGNASLTAGQVQLGQAFAAPALATETAILFTQTNASGVTTPYSLAPTHGTGQLRVTAGLIDIGNLSLQGIGTADFNAATGDIRGNGTLSAVGHLSLTAGQIYPTTASRFSVFAYDFTAGGLPVEGSVSIHAGVNRQTPLSAGGTLGIYASQITHGGTLRAPIGKIILGWDHSGTAPVDPISGSLLSAPATTLLTLTSGSLTSVSAVADPSEIGSLIPYGISLDGDSWIDPAGNDITVGGVPGKSIQLAALALVTADGSTIDIGGGGDLYAYRWIAGNGGSKDILASQNSFAVLPGYTAMYAPYAPFNTSATATSLGGQTGYVNSTLKAGDQITLAASKDLAAGTYTLLPARYALLPGAFLITPQSGTPGNALVQPDGASIVAGYRSNNLNAARSGATLISRFEVASTPVVRSRAEYQDLLANTVLSAAAISREFAVPRLPQDAGYLSFSSTSSMTLRGAVSSVTSDKGRGSSIDIDSAAAIFIGSASSGSSGLILDPALLNSFGAESLLIGGLRTFGSAGTTVTANSGSVTLDNAGTALTGEDIVLVAREKLTLAPSAEISGTGGTELLDTLLLGDATIAGSGSGTLVRVSGSENAAIRRVSVSASTPSELVVHAGVRLSGGSVALDSTSRTTLDPAAHLLGRTVSLSSGQVSIVLSDPGVIQANPGLVLAGAALTGLQNSASHLSLASYSNIDFYGHGTLGSGELTSLSLQAATIRGYNSGAAGVTLAAASLSLANPSASQSAASLATPLAGVIRFEAADLTLGANAVRLDGFATSSLTATQRLLVTGSGSFSTAGELNLHTPLLTGASAANHRIAAAGLLTVDRSAASAKPAQVGGFGAELTLQGARIEFNGDVNLPAGELTLRATSGDLVIGNREAANLNLAGTMSRLVDVTRYTNGGTVNLTSDHGAVLLDPLATVSVAAASGGGNAGKIKIAAPEGSFALTGTILGAAGVGGQHGAFSLDAATLTDSSLASLDAILNSGSFTRFRDYRIRTGDVKIDGLAIAQDYRVTADAGSITAAGEINAVGLTGGRIELRANRNLTILSGAVLNARGAQFDAAGKGGTIVLETGAMLDLQSGSTIQLAVAAAQADSAALGRFSGTLDLRAPRTADNADVQILPIGSAITGASAIRVEATKLYNLSATGLLNSSVLSTIRSEAEMLLGSAGTTTPGYTAMLNRLTANQPSLDLILTPGAELINPTGSLTLGSKTSTADSDWNLSSLRFGPRQTAGVLTMRAAENITLFNALSDGFAGGSSLWLSPLVEFNPLLPANSQSWSFHLTAGADLTSANYRAVRPLDNLGATAGMLQLGKNTGAATATGGANALTSSLLGNAYQVIRTGSGNIDITAGRSVQLLNPFASIYTAGTKVPVATTVFSSSDFVVPILNRTVAQGNLGAAQQTYLAQYSLAGGNVAINVSEDIERKTANNSGLIDDSSRQLPNNWLGRRGYVGSNGEFGKIRIGSGISAVSDPAASTTWWVDFSNFFQGVGALGGGNIDLTAGRNVTNVDAVIPTNARAPRGLAASQTLLELGGGNLQITAGNDLSGGIYYLERGQGTLTAGRDITTNATRSPSFGLVGNLNNPSAARLDPVTWLPTTLFVGKSSFELTAAGDLLLGPVSNPFLLPQGVTNRFWYKTYFSTIDPASQVSAVSLGGDLTYRNAVTLPGQNQAQPLLRAWHESQLLLTGSASSTAWLQPWLRLAETNLTPFSPVWSLTAASVSLTALSGDTYLTGNLTTFPSASGQLEIIAAGSIHGLGATGFSNILNPGVPTQSWFASTINLSDADPLAVPALLTPLSVATETSSGAVVTSETALTFMEGLAALFGESGSITGTNAVLQTRQARHTPDGLHSADTEPLRLYALEGSLSGLTLFSAKQARISAGSDLTDVALYLQNNGATDTSVVTAGRDLIAFNSNSPLRVASRAIGNALSFGQSALAGDLQISGPGSLQVLAGRNLDLGIGANNPDGTGTGITSIGNLRNPYLTPVGADLIVGAGIGPSLSLANSDLAFATFINDFVTTPEGLKLVEELAPGVDFSTQSPEAQASIALDVFYRLLRDTGRSFNDPDSPGFRNYDSGLAAIAALFPTTTPWDGGILTQGRDIRTKSGGSISIFTPGGGLTMAETTIGNPLAPPGIITEGGGGISIFANESVSIGIGRIFTLRGGDVAIWSSEGDIAAGSSSRTVQSAPPTRVIVDPQSAAVATDLAGLATGGGIGVLATVEGVEPGDVDLIAPAGVIDAGDAGIRVSGNINLAAITVVNAGNISASGSSTGAPAASVSAPSVSAVTSASNAAAAGNNTTVKPGQDQQQAPTAKPENEIPSLITVEVIGYGGGSDEDEEEENAEP